MQRLADTTAIILAAGKGTRMGSDLAKVLHPVGGKPMVNHVLASCAEAGIARTVVVVGWQRERVEAAIAGSGAATVLQDRQLGTGHAVLVTEPAVPDGDAVILCGDAPLVPAALLRELVAGHRRDGNACTVVGARMADPTGYGRLVTDGGRLLRIVEHKDATPEQRAIDLVNSGIYCVRRSDLFRCLHQVRPNNVQGEYYLTDVVGMLVREGARVGLTVSDRPELLLGVNTPADLAAAERICAGR